MLMSSVNSLVEVGIGINLAFGAFKGMRDSLYNVFVELLKTEVDTIQARLNETPNGENCISAVAIKAEDISNNYSDSGRNYTNKIVILALISATLLTGFLALSAIMPNQEISNWLIWPCLLFVVGPFSIAAFAQFVLYRIARRALSHRLLPYKNYVDVSEEISPRPPIA